MQSPTANVMPMQYTSYMLPNDATDAARRLCLYISVDDAEWTKAK
jgi:hypothetical protein